MVLVTSDKGLFAVFIYVLLFFAVAGNRFQHGNYLSSNDQFLDSSNDAGFVLVSSEVKVKNF